MALLRNFFCNIKNIRSCKQLDAFYIAEVYARASNLVKAKEYYDMGVKASLSQHGISDTDILNNYAEWVDGTQEQNIKQIAMQKWVANANYQHITFSPLSNYIYFK